MSHTGEMRDERLGVAETYGTGHQGKSIHEGHVLFLAALQFASDQTAERRHLASYELMEGRVRQSGIGNLGDSAMLLQKLGDGQCRRAMPFRSPFQRLQAAQKEEGGQRRNSGAGEVAQLMAPDRFDNAFWSRHDADDKIAMPPMNLVAECTTRSAPRTMCCCNAGVAKVFSMIARAPAWCAIRLTAAM
jgi:hypothetical protein